MDTKRRTYLTLKRSRLMHAVALGLILTLGVLLIPSASATGNAQSNLEAGTKTTDDSGWSALGTGVNGEVRAIAISGNDVYAGGMFDSAGTCAVGCSNIARWNTTTQSWSALDTGVDGEVRAIAVHNNLVYVGGSFGHAGPISTTRIAVWDGSTWSALATGMDDVVNAIATSGSDVYVGGMFKQAGGCTGAGHGCYFVARWLYSSWTALGTGTDSYVNAIAEGGTRVYVGGIFGSASGTVNTADIAAWDKPGWSALDTGMNWIGTSVDAIAVSGSDVYAGGTFDNAGGVPAINIAKWNNGSGWSALGSGIGDNGNVNAIAVSGSDVYAGGGFRDRDNGAPNRIAKWNSGSGWSALGNGTDGNVYAIAISGNEVYVGGSFNSADGVANTHGIAKYTASVSVKVYLPLVLRAS
jgi:hypothetical protein